MRNLQQISTKIKGVDELKSIVRTLKTLSAVNVRQLEIAGTNLASYLDLIKEAMLSIYLATGSLPISNISKPVRPCFVIVGSDQGLCGAYNHIIVTFLIKVLSELGSEKKNDQLFAIGHKCMEQLRNHKLFPTNLHSLPVSISGISKFSGELYAQLNFLLREFKFDSIFFIYLDYQSKSVCLPTKTQLLPIQTDTIESIKLKKNPFRNGPLLVEPTAKLFEGLLEKFLLTKINGIVSSAMASENLYRLQAMQSAEKQMEEKLEEFRLEYQSKRQDDITSELLDIISGYQVILDQEKSSPRYASLLGAGRQNSDGRR